MFLPLTKPSFNYFLVSPQFLFVTSSVTFLFDVAAVKRQGEHIIDRSMEVITSSCLGESFSPPRKPRPVPIPEVGLITDWA